MFRLLVWLKSVLIVRTLVRRRGWAGVASTAVLVVAFSPFWLGAAAISYKAVSESGAPTLGPLFALTQVGWLYVAIMLGAYSEAFDLRRMLRYPVAPRTVYLLNVLATPIDIVALFTLPSLIAATAAIATRAGNAAAVGAAVGALLLIVSTAALLQLLLAALSGLLRHEWARAAGGLALGVAIFVVAWKLRGPMTAPSATGLVVEPGVMPSVTPILPAMGPLFLRAAPAARLMPFAALPAAVAAAALDGRWLAAALWSLASLALIVATILVGARLATRGALEREIRAADDAPRPTGRTAPRLTAILERVLPLDLATLVERELRYYLRTPQILVGLLTTPVIIAFFFTIKGSAMPPPLPVYFAGFLTLTPALNLSANQFGLDREGVRLLFLLPIAPKRMMLSKNLTIVVLVVLETAISTVTYVATGAGSAATAEPIDALVALAAIFAILPGMLFVGNFLSVRSPWRVASRSAGAPKGAIGSAFAQVTVLIVLTGLLSIPILGGHFLFAELGPVVPLAGIAIIGGAAWLTWGLALDRVGRSLVRRREALIDALAHAEETG